VPPAGETACQQTVDNYVSAPQPSGTLIAKQLFPCLVFARRDRGRWLNNLDYTLRSEKIQRNFGSLVPFSAPRALILPNTGFQKVHSYLQRENPSVVQDLQDRLPGRSRGVS